MASNTPEDPQSSSPPLRQPRLISQLARIEVEERERPRKMRLMFGEHQVVFLRSDGLRSRMARKNKKNTEESSASEDPEAGSSNLSEIIDGVATGRIGTESYDSVNSLSTSSSSPTSVDPISTTNFETSAIGTEGGTSTESFEPRTKTGNRSYHPPRQFHGISTMVTHKRRWTYQTACNINAAEQNNDNQITYVSNPFLPLPRGNRRNGMCTATRMNYAAQRIDNRKYRAQAQAHHHIMSSGNDDSVSCEKCKMKYYFESMKAQKLITYEDSTNDEFLPVVRFNCPVCKELTKASF
ncbi:hypothetical protein CRE_20207 [Caenorhabditis remanei]|uniref:Uncharacterized protein n=1 Tax=Caenorhabditis remanei TaxID=31234 RepID=E3MCN1_CAERE|nr:hypothetical protein CRE_20207 [Caenorhabditis remanei]